MCRCDEREPSEECLLAFPGRKCVWNRWVTLKKFELIRVSVLYIDKWKFSGIDHNVWTVLNWYVTVEVLYMQSVKFKPSILSSLLLQD